MNDLQELHIHGMWGERTEMIEVHVLRIIDTFRLCAQLSEHWQTWYRPYQTEEEWRQPALLLNENSAAIRAELINGMVRDDSGEADETLGYAMGAFAGPEKGTRNQCTLFRVSCGKQGPYSGPNKVSFKLPNEGNAKRDLYNPDLLAHALKGLEEIWRPDWLVVRNLLSNVMEPPRKHGPVLGWVNFLPNRTAKIESLPPGWRWADEGDRTIFIFEKGIPDDGDPLHKNAVEEMVKQLTWT